jgi:putative transposase
MKTDYPLRSLCETLDVSPSGYYAWQRRPSQPSIRTQEDACLSQAIALVFTQSRQTYGSPRIQIQLRDWGYRHGRNRIARSFQPQGFSSGSSRSWI